MSETRDPTAVLRAALDAANARASAAARGEAEARNQLRGETVNRVAAQEQAVDNAIVAAESERSSLTERWSVLQAEGNFAEAGKVMGQMAEASARVDRFKAQKDWLSGQRQQAATQPAPTDPLANYNDAERSWISQNPAYLSDPAFKRKVDFAAMEAIERKGLVKDSQEYFEHVDRSVHPDRYAAAAPQATEQAARQPEGGAIQARDAAAPAGQDDDDSPLSGAEISVDTTSPPQQQHTRDANPAPVSTDGPVMRIETTADGADGAVGSQPQTRPPRAVGNGGGGIRAVAAPPSRRIVQASNQAARGGMIEPTMEELLTARSLYDAIEPNATDRSDIAAVRWYHAMAHHPSHQHTRRRNWARDSVL